MIDLGKVKVPILEKNGSTTWKVMEDNGFMNCYKHDSELNEDEWVFSIAGKKFPSLRVSKDYPIDSHDEMIGLCQALSVAYQMYEEHYAQG